MKDAARTPLRERVPIDIVASLIRTWQDEYRADHEEAAKSALSSRYVETSLNNEGHLNILAFHCGMSARRLRLIKSGRFDIGGKRTGTFEFVNWVPFDIADKIVCATVGPYAWQQEPLKEFYGPLTVRAYERQYEEAA